MRWIPSAAESHKTASSPQLSWPIYNETADTYSVWVRGMAPDAGGDSLHVGLDGGTPSTAADLTGFTNEWSWSEVTPTGNATVDTTTTGEHTLDAWMREDGLRVDRVLLVTDTNYIPSGLGPAESSFQTITETVPGGLGTTTISYGYDALYRLTDAAYSGAITVTFAYNYDPVGNMTAFTETVDAQTTSVSRSFDNANRLEYAVDAGGTTTYTFDANGNLIELLPPGATGATPVGGVRYDYDQRNLMVSQETNPDGTAWVLQAEYVYDGGNDRLQQVDYTGVTPITTTYTNDIFGLTQVLVAGDGTDQVVNLFGLDLISQDSGAEVRTLLVDGLGSVRLEMVGAVVETTTTYKPYGEVLEQAGTSGTVYGFTGEQEDDATGLLYLRARYYDSSLKAFMSRDPWEGTGRRPETLNYYLYAENNPTNLVDPTGNCVGFAAGLDTWFCSAASAGAGLASAVTAPVVGGGVVLGVAVHDLIVSPLLGTPAFTPGLVSVLEAVLEECATGVQAGLQQLDDVYRVSREIWRNPQTRTSQDTRHNPKQQLRPLGPDLLPIPTPTRTSSYFYYADMSERAGEIGYLYEDGYPFPGRPARVIANGLDAYSHIPGIGVLQDDTGHPTGMIEVVIEAERLVEDHPWQDRIMMGRKFEAERALWFAGRASSPLIGVSPYSPHSDLQVTNFDTIRYIEVKWGENGIRSGTVADVIQKASAHRPGELLLEANEISMTQERELQSGGGIELPPEIRYP